MLQWLPELFSWRDGRTAVSAAGREIPTERGKDRDGQSEREEV